MYFLPKVIEDIILDYKSQLEHVYKTKKIFNEIDNIKYSTNDNLTIINNNKNIIYYIQPNHKKFLLYGCNNTNICRDSITLELKQI